MALALSTIILTAVALAMDTFSVSITQGFVQKRINIRQILSFALFSGGFEFLMPVIGYIFGESISRFVTTVAPWIAFILLLAIGLNMIRESFGEQEEEDYSKFSYTQMTLLSIATSIDAFVVGFSYALIDEAFLFPCIVIGIISFSFCVFGMIIGTRIGNVFGSRLEILGGIVLILIGLEVLLTS